MSGVGHVTAAWSPERRRPWSWPEWSSPPPAESSLSNCEPNSGQPPAPDVGNVHAFAESHHWRALRCATFFLSPQSVGAPYASEIDGTRLGSSRSYLRPMTLRADAASACQIIVELSGK